MAEVAGDRRDPALRFTRGSAGRRDPAQQRPLVGGSRASDPPLTTRACADWMGVTPSWIRSAITEGVPVRGGLVTLDAEVLVLSAHRRLYRVHLDQFIVFLRAIGWRRIPALPRDRSIRLA